MSQIRKQYKGGAMKGEIVLRGNKTYYTFTTIKTGVWIDRKLNGAEKKV